MTGAGSRDWPWPGHSVVVRCGACQGGPPKSDGPCWARCGAGRKQSQIYVCSQWVIEELESRSLVRRRVDRLAGDGSYKVSDATPKVKVRGLHPVPVRDDKAKPDTAQVEASYRRMTVRLPIGKQ